MSCRQRSLSGASRGTPRGGLGALAVPSPSSLRPLPPTPRASRAAASERLEASVPPRLREPVGRRPQSWSPCPWRRLGSLQLHRRCSGWGRALTVRAASARRFLQRRVGTGEREAARGAPPGAKGSPWELRKCCRHRPRRKSVGLGGKRVGGKGFAAILCVRRLFVAR